MIHLMPHRTALIIFLLFALFTLVFVCISRDANPLSRCEVHDDKCQRSTITHLLARSRISDITSYIQFYAESSDENCHNLMHLLGEEVYLRNQTSQISALSADMQQCSLGFWHGFMTRYTRDDGASIQEAISYCNKPKNFQYQRSCFHGIGIGLIGDRVQIKNTEEINQLYLNADSICPTNLNDENYYECVTGAFHQVFAEIFRIEHLPLHVDSKQLISLCSDQQVSNNSACLSQLAPQLATAYTPSHHEMTMYISEIDPLYAPSFFIPLISVYIRNYPDDTTSIISNCIENIPILFQSCVDSILTALENDNERITAKRLGLEFCDSDSFSPQQKKGCSSHVAQRYLNVEEN